MARLLKLYRRYLLPVGVLSGTIIGAGMFSLPFVFSKTGLVGGLLYLLLAAALYTLIHGMYADLFLLTPGEHRFVGYARLYLGQIGFWLAVAVSVVQMILVLAIYLVLSQSFVQLMTGGGGGAWGMIGFWFAGSAAIFVSVRRLALFEFLSLIGIVGVIFFIFLLGIPEIGNARRFLFLPDSSFLLLPLGPLLFSLAGRVAIPSLVGYLRAQEGVVIAGFLKRIITIGTFLPAAVYALFVIGVLGLSPVPTEDAVSGLVAAVGNGTLGAIGILGFLALWSSYIVIGSDVNGIFRHDLPVARGLRFGMLLLVPLCIALVAIERFLGLVAVAGGIFLALEGVLVMLMWRKAHAGEAGKGRGILRNVHPFIQLALAAVFLAAFFSVIISRAS